MKAPRSLKARALQWLAQREQSRSELRRKLLRHAQAEAASATAASAAASEHRNGAKGDAHDTGDDGALDEDGNGCLDAAEAASSELLPAARVDALLDWLEANKYLSQERFAESRVNARAARFGNLRIRQELKQHQVALSPEAMQSLKDSELERARAVLERKFGTLPSNAVDQGKQARFLAGRGFSPDVIGSALRRSKA